MGKEEATFYLLGLKLIFSGLPFRAVLVKVLGPALASILGHLKFKIIFCSILIDKRPHMVLASGLIQDLGVVVDEAKGQPDGEEGHQGDLSGDDHVDGSHGDDDDFKLHLNEETPSEEDGILSIERVPPKQLKMLHLNIKIS